MIDWKYYFRRVTRGARSLPDFIIPGAQKCGTTSLAYYLNRHPDIYFVKGKELNYFDLNIREGLASYRTHFPLKMSRRFHPALLSGESSPDYMIYPQIARAMHELMPELKLIFLLKNPVDRLFSQYKHNLAKKRESLSLEKALELESLRTQDLSFIDIYETSIDAIKMYANYSYRERGLYAKQLEWFFEVFPREQILVIQSERMFSNSDSVFRECLRFLGLKDISLQEYKVINSARVSFEEDPKIREELESFYRPHNIRLYELLGETYDW